MSAVEYATLITGASAGIGFSVAQQLVHAGARHLVITGRNAAQLENAATVLAKTPQVQVYPIVCDHRQKEAIELLAASLQELPVPVLHVVANVGENPVHQHGPSKTHSTAYELFSQTLTTNLTHTFYLLAKLLPAMRQAREGRVVLVGSQAYRYGIPGQVCYNVAKSGLVGLKNTLVREYSTANIFCHLLNPGLVLNARTERMRKHLTELADQHGVTEAQVANAVLELLKVDDKARNGLEVDL